MRRPGRAAALAALILASAALAAQASPAPSPSWPAAVSFGLYESGYMYDPASDRGIDKDLALELGRRLGFRVEFKVLPRGRIWIELAEGSLLMTGSARETPERGPIALFVPYVLSVNRVVRLKGSPASQGDFLASATAIWGGIRGYAYEPDGEAFLSAVDASGRLDLSGDMESLVSLMRKGRISAFISQPPIYGFYIDRFGLRGKVSIENWFAEPSPSWGGVALSRKRFGEAERQAVARAIAAMREDGALRRIFASYLGDEADLMLGQAR